MSFLSSCYGCSHLTQGTFNLNLNLTRLLDDAKCYETVRQLGWQLGGCCPKCRSA